MDRCRARGHLPEVFWTVVACVDGSRCEQLSEGFERDGTVYCLVSEACPESSKCVDVFGRHLMDVDEVLLICWSIIGNKGAEGADGYRNFCRVNFPLKHFRVHAQFDGVGDDCGLVVFSIMYSVHVHCALVHCGAGSVTAGDAT